MVSRKVRRTKKRLCGLAFATGCYGKNISKSFLETSDIETSKVELPVIETTDVKTPVKADVETSKVELPVIETTDVKTPVKADVETTDEDTPDKADLETPDQETPDAKMYSDTSSSESMSDVSTIPPGSISMPQSDSSLDCPSEKVFPCKSQTFAPNESGAKERQEYKGDYRDLLALERQEYEGMMKVALYVHYGLLTIHIVAGRNIHSKRRNPPDTYVKVGLIPDNIKRARCKTEVFYESDSPDYDEKFSFELTEEHLRKRILISVYHRGDIVRDCEFLGCVSFGIGRICQQNEPMQGWFYLLLGDVGRERHVRVPDDKLPLNEHRDIQEVVIQRGATGKLGFSITGICPVRVCRVDLDSTAYASGLRQHDIICRINGKAVSGMPSADVAQFIRNESEIVLQICPVGSAENPGVGPGFERNSLSQVDIMRMSSQVQLHSNSSSSTQSTSSWQTEPISRNKRSFRNLSDMDVFTTKDYGWLDSDETDEMQRENQVEYVQTNSGLSERRLSAVQEVYAFPPKNVKNSLEAILEVTELESTRVSEPDASVLSACTSDSVVVGSNEQCQTSKMSFGQIPPLSLLDKENLHQLDIDPSATKKEKDPYARHSFRIKRSFSSDFTDKTVPRILRTASLILHSKKADSQPSSDAKSQRRGLSRSDSFRNSLIFSKLKTALKPKN